MSGKGLGPWILLAIVHVLAPFRALAQTIDHFDVNTSVGNVTNGVPFTVVVTAVGPDGMPVTNAQGVVGLSAFKPGPAEPVISEVFRTGATIEIANPGTQPLDLSDWELEALADYPGYGAPPSAPNARLRFPPGTILPPQSVVTWTDRGVPPGAYPAFVSSKPFATANGFYLTRLLNAKGEPVDEVYMRNAVYAADNALWKGVGLGSCPTNFSYTRIGFANHFRNLDWTTNSPTPGTLNPTLQLPWTNTGTYYTAAPATVQLSNGTWAGSIIFSNLPLGTVWLKADNGAGVSGGGPPVAVLDYPKLTLVVPQAVSNAFESQAGLVGYVTVLIPDASVSDLLVSLPLSDTNEFILPAQVTIPAGTNAVSVVITNLDDGIADGDAIVTLTATAPGYAAASATLLNSDAETGTLFVTLPNTLAEDCGFEAEPCRVFLSEPARHDVLVRLTADPPLEVPSSIIIPKGELSQSFRLRVGADGLVNPSPWLVHVRAQTGNWPWADAVITLTDQDDGSFVVSLPSAMIEGTTASGQIQVKTAHQVDTTFSLTSKNSRLKVPAQVTLPAGALTVSFSLQVTNNFVPDPQTQVQVCAQTAGQPSVCNALLLLDDEVDIKALVPGKTPKAVFSNQPFMFSALLGNSYSQPQVTNTFGQLDVLADMSVARLDPNPNPLQFTNGAWTNQIVLVGEALGIQLRVSAAGFQTDTPRLDLLPGLDVPIGLSDAVWNRSLGKFLVAESAQTNAPAKLTEIDPWSGARGRSLDLPRQVQRIALSDDGQVAWLASTSNTLQRVDLAAWQFNCEYSIDPATTNAYALELLVLPGEVDRLLAVTSTNRLSWRAVLYDQGLPLTNRVTLPGANLTVAALAAGRAGEVFCQSSYYLSRLVVVSNGVMLDRYVQLSSGADASLSFSGSNVFRGTGEVFLPDTLATAPPFATQSSLLGIPCPDWSAALFIEQNNTLKTYDLNTRQALGSHALPDSVASASRLLRWSQRGFATFSAAGKVLSIFQTPLLTTNLPDLVLTAFAPSSATIPPNGAPVSFSWQFGITNHGTGPAPGVQLRLDSGANYLLGTLAPGQGVSTTVQQGSYYVGIFHTTATALCAVADAHSWDNVVTVVTRVQKQDMPSASQLILGMTHLIASPTGDRLYVSVASSAGDIQDGVAVVNPEHGTIEQMLPVGSSPQHLAISPDGSDLYVLLGTNRVIRWNLPANSNALSLTLTNDAVIDFIPNPASPHSLVVSTKAHVAVFDEAQIRPATFESPIDRRYLGYAGGSLWTAEPGYLRSFTISAGGLVAGTTMPFTLFSDYYPFASDGRHLFFSGAIVDTVTGGRLNTFLGDHFCVDLPNSSVFTAVGGYLRRYSLFDYSLQGQQWLSQAGDTYQTDPVRWGDSGVAVRSGPQLLMVRSALVPATNLTDLSVSVIPPMVAIPNQTMEWSVILTNKSGQVAPCTMLNVSWGDLRDLQIDGPYSYQTYSTMLYDAGAMPAHSSATFKIRGWAFAGGMTMTASVQTSAKDTNPADNTASASVPVDYPATDLGILSVSAPARVQLGDEFEAAFVFTNAGPLSADSTLLYLNDSAGLQFLGVKGDAFPTNAYGPLLGPLAPGESRTAVLRYKAVGAGLLQVSATADGSVSDTQSKNNLGATWVYAVPSSTNDVLTELTFPGSIMAWDRSRQQVLAAFPGNAWSLLILGPVTLEPVREIPLPGLPNGIAPCNNGRHAWISLSGGAAVRVDLTTGTLEQQFSFDAAQSPVYAVAAPPGQSNLLVVAFDPGYLGNNHLQVFDNGTPRPIGYGPLGWSGGGEPLLFTPDGRLYLACSQILRQLQVTPSGLAEVRRLDSAGLYSGLALSYATNRLFFSEGRIVDLNTGVADDTLLDTSPVAADDETGFAYTASASRILWGGPPMIIRRMDALTLNTQWRQVLYLPSSEVNTILSMGTNGCLIIGDKIRLLNPTRIGSPSVDLAVAFSPLPSVSDVTVPLPVQVTVTNKSSWAAQQTVLSLQLPMGLVFAPSSIGAGSAIANLDLGAFYGATNLSFLVLPLTNGTFSMHASVTNNLPELVPWDNQEDLLVTVASPPVFFFDNTAVLEGSNYRPGSLVGWLSRPPLTNVSVSFTITPLTAQTSDFSKLSGVFQFAAGQTHATCTVIIADATPELDETALLVFSSTNLILAQPSALLTILNDDFPQVNVTNVSLADGASGYTNANFKVTLSAAAPFPVDVAFQVVPGSAIPGSDYLPRQGWLHFAPGETLKTVSVPVAGDRAYKPNKTAYFNLQQAVGATFGSVQGLLTIINDDLPPAPAITISLVPGGLSIDFNSVLGATYQLQSRTNFTSDPWHTRAGSIQGTGGPVTFSIPAPSQKAVFYRVAGK